MVGALATAVAVCVGIAALALYDMCKAVDKKMRIEGIRVLEKVKE